VNFVPARLERGAEERDRRALAVRSGHMEDRRKLVLRSTQPVEQRSNPFEPKPVAGRGQLR
jgi:hypothetical protein